ncbi:NTP transferase domain-containing protein [Embleya sp. MST-111070]|uniref:phosphocholine cytidylyltransferase family protein n=1 Tax=Embleya sp. MST-111070 TaxID=3398231 RepID=UPI003F7342D3
MIGLVLAAGAGRRLRPHTDTLPKALVPVGAPGAPDSERSILEVTLSHYAAVGLTEAAIVIGYCGDAIRERQDLLERRYGLKLRLVDNDKAEEWNNAYSLWCARDHLADGVLLANGDTLHPLSVQETMLAARGGDKGIILALDTAKPLADEEMKVTLGDDGRMRRITKLMDPAEAAGEYIGVTLIEGHAAPALVDALRATFERDPQLYYEDGYQELVNRGGRVDVQPIGAPDIRVPWTEIDTTEDLTVAREIACRY